MACKTKRKPKKLDGKFCEGCDRCHKCGGTKAEHMVCPRDRSVKVVPWYNPPYYYPNYPWVYTSPTATVTYGGTFANTSSVVNTNTVPAASNIGNVSYSLLTTGGGNSH